MQGALPPQEDPLTHSWEKGHPWECGLWVLTTWPLGLCSCLKLAPTSRATVSSMGATGLTQRCCESSRHAGSL